ncbi:DUF1843 domain-containing protein [uncultured Hoeflea sp.]|uniref:DUF1843 domain-containing protein n=1 Tax=uncultured Hoeflea sp. TaxID=538666 RepID=UPI002635313D|nr:DUF1843 domain-containing protein [uncultured Hoeflea sp.]
MVVVAYGTAIGQALENPKTSLDELIVLRDHATAILKAQGDLKGALEKLEVEIRDRERRKK